MRVDSGVDGMVFGVHAHHLDGDAIAQAFFDGPFPEIGSFLGFSSVAGHAVAAAAASVAVVVMVCHIDGHE